MTTSITFWGTGDSMGVPRVYCDCGVCGEARSPEGKNRRLRSSVHVKDDEFGTLLIDCGPDWRAQMEAAGLRRIERMLLTHAHFDHIGGLAEWADMCRWVEFTGEAYAMPGTIGEIDIRFPWIARNIRFIPIDGAFRLGSWSVDCWKVNHGQNGFAYAFRFTDPVNGKAWAYCPDAISLTEEQQRPLFGLDLLVIGTSFYKEPFPLHTRSVYDVSEVMELLKAWKPGRAVFTHMSHDIDIRHDYGLPDNVRFAAAGLTVDV